MMRLQLRSLLALPLLASSLLAGTANYAGHKVHYSVSGDAKSALVLVHGWTCDESFCAAYYRGQHPQAIPREIGFANRGHSSFPDSGET